MRAVVKMWRLLVGSGEKEAGTNLHSSAQWSREEMATLLEQAKIHRKAEELELERVRKKELAALDTFDRVAKSLGGKE